MNFKIEKCLSFDQFLTEGEVYNDIDIDQEVYAQYPYTDNDDELLKVVELLLSKVKKRGFISATFSKAKIKKDLDRLISTLGAISAGDKNRELDIYSYISVAYFINDRGNKKIIDSALFEKDKKRFEIFEKVFIEIVKTFKLDYESNKSEIQRLSDLYNLARKIQLVSIKNVSKSIVTYYINEFKDQADIYVDLGKNFSILPYAKHFKRTLTKSKEEALKFGEEQAQALLESNFDILEDYEKGDS